MPAAAVPCICSSHPAAAAPAVPIPRPDPATDAILTPLQQVVPPLNARGRGPIHAGALWSGFQRSGRTSYDVSVTLTHVDVQRGTGGGYLLIRGLTPALPVLQTYFDIEIIGQHHGFLTDKWGATEIDDLKHWSRFPLFRTLIKPSLPASNLRSLWDQPYSPVLFMRWKERFVVPDHRQSHVTGASFDGFYYVCCDLTPPRAALPASPLPLTFDTAIGGPRTKSTALHRPVECRTRSPSQPLGDRPLVRPLSTPWSASSSPSTPTAAFSYAAVARRNSTPASVAAHSRLHFRHLPSPDRESCENPFGLSDPDFPPPLWSPQLSSSSARPQQRSTSAAPSSTSATSTSPVQAREGDLLAQEAGAVKDDDTAEEQRHIHGSQASTLSQPPLFFRHNTNAGLSTTETSHGGGSDDVDDEDDGHMSVRSHASSDQKLLGSATRNLFECVPDGTNTARFSDHESANGPCVADQQSTMGWWQDAKIVAFYFHALSAPYQELVLQYQLKDRGGSASYEFA